MAQGNEKTRVNITACIDLIDYAEMYLQIYEDSRMVMLYNTMKILYCIMDIKKIQISVIKN